MIVAVPAGSVTVEVVPGPGTVTVSGGNLTVVGVPGCTTVDVTVEPGRVTVTGGNRTVVGVPGWTTVDVTVWPGPTCPEVVVTVGPGTG